VTFAQADLHLIWHLYTYRYLSSGQLACRCGRSQQVVRRAIRRRLKPEGYVLSLQRQPAEEAAYTLGSAGLALVAHELGCPVSHLPWPRTSTSRGLYWKHTTLVTDIRIALDLACEADASPVAIRRTIPEWHINPSARRAEPVLFERFKAPDGGTQWHRPDCVFLMHQKDSDERRDVAVFLEADRNSEAVQSRIRAKYAGYYEYWGRRRFADAFGAVAMRVLFVLDNVTDRRRIQSMQAELRRFCESKSADAEPFRRCFRFALKRDISRSTVLSEPIWYTADDEPRLFFQPVQQPAREAGTEVAA
jgi:hypothetical protein